MGQIVLIIVFTAIGIFFGILTIEDENNVKRAIYLILFTFAMGGLLVMIFMLIISAKNDIISPTALDVYRGKTELQVNKIYKNDSILVGCDSIVIMKDNNLNSNE